MSRPFGSKKNATHTQTHAHTVFVGARLLKARRCHLTIFMVLASAPAPAWAPATPVTACCSLVRALFNKLLSRLHADRVPAQHRHQQQPQQQQQHEVILQLSVIYKWGVQQRAPLSSPCPALGVAARCFASCCYQSANKLSCIGTALDSSLPSLPPNCPSVACLRLPPLL